MHQKTYEKIADCVHRIGDTLGPTAMIMPIGLDGAVVYHLLYHYTRRLGNPPDNLDLTVHISSKYHESDKEKFENVLDASKDRKVYALDLRTKTGSLGSTLDHLKRDWESRNNQRSDLFYTVLFDRGHHAVLRGCEEDLPDTERPLWVPVIEDARNIIRKVHLKNNNDHWVYDLSHERIATFDHVAGIKRFLDAYRHVKN